MQENVNRVLERGDRLEDLTTRTDDLEASVGHLFAHAFIRSVSHSPDTIS